MTPAELDKQSPVKIDEWLDIDSEKCKEMDEDRQFTKKILRIGFEDGWLFTDIHGRIFGKPNKGEVYFPLHFEWGKKKFGYKMSKKASN